MPVLYALTFSAVLASLEWVDMIVPGWKDVWVDEYAFMDPDALEATGAVAGGKLGLTAASDPNVGGRMVAGLEW